MKRTEVLVLQLSQGASAVQLPQLSLRRAGSLLATSWLYAVPFSAAAAKTQF